MTNQQGAPDALTDFERRHAIRQGYEIAASDGYFEARPQIDSNDRRKVFQAGFERGWDRHAALVEAQQAAPSAASKAVLAAIRAANMQLMRTGDDEFMLVTYKNAKAQCDGGKCGIGGYCDDCPAPQAYSQPAPQGETNVQLDTDSNHSAPGQQRDVAGSVALGQPVGNGSDQAAGHTGAQGDKLLIVAERNIRSFLRSAVFKSESDREAALNCVDVLWEAARAPADSVTAPAGCEVAGWQMVPIKPTHDMLCALSGEWHPSRHQPERYAAMLAAAPTPPAQAADSVLEDADPIRALIAQHAAILDQNESAYFELCYHRATGWMAWITDKPLCMPPVVNPDRKVLAQGQGDTADEACRDAARKQGSGT